MRALRCAVKRNRNRTRTMTANHEYIIQSHTCISLIRNRSAKSIRCFDRVRANLLASESQLKLERCISFLRQVSFLGRPFVKRFALCYQTVVCRVCPVLSGSPRSDCPHPEVAFPTGTGVPAGPIDVSRPRGGGALRLQQLGRAP